MYNDAVLFETKQRDFVMKNILPLVALGALLLPFTASAEKIGSVQTEWKLMGKNSTIQVEAVDDPQIKNVSCWLTYPVKGGAMASLGLGADPSNASIACRARGYVNIKEVLKLGTKPTEIFKVNKSIFFKAMRVVRIFDKKRNTLVYMTYTKELFNGSPKSSVSTVVISTK